MAAAAELRGVAVQICTTTQINGDAYRAASSVISAIDGLAGALTGNCEHFWLKTGAATPSPQKPP